MAERTCSVEGCHRKHKGHGYCSMHWQRWRKYDTPLLPVRPSFEERFWAKIDRRGTNDCWSWLAATAGRGYGVFGVGQGRMQYAHRISYELAGGSIPDGSCIDHLCRNILCVNPAHLEPVTPMENARRSPHFTRRRRPEPATPQLKRFRALADLTPEKRLEVEARFWQKVAKSATCWQWTATTNRLGYGLVTIHYRSWRAHRVAYELLVGPIPVGLELDHLCDNPGCVNPAHLRPVTHRENILRSSAPTAINGRARRCIRGHAFNDANTYINKRGGRGCRACHRERARLRKLGARLT